MATMSSKRTNSAAGKISSSTRKSCIVHRLYILRYSQFFIFIKNQLVNEPVPNVSIPGTFKANPIELSQLIINITEKKYDELVSLTEAEIAEIEEQCAKIIDPLEKEALRQKLTHEYKLPKVLKLIQSVNPNRPMPQNAPHTPTLEYPLDQYLYSPVKIMGYFYNPETEEVVPPNGWDPDTQGPIWDEKSEKILLSSSIDYDATSAAEIEVVFNEEDRETTTINGTDFPQQNGGYYAGTIGAIDGGVVGEDGPDPGDKHPTAIAQYLNMVVTRPYDKIKMDLVPSSLDEFYLFLNGILLYPNIDYTIDEDGQIEFAAAVLEYGDKIYAFENLAAEKGCLKNRVRMTIPETTKRIDCEDIHPTSYILPFYDGELVFLTSYEVQEGSVKFVNTLDEGKNIDITECLFSPDSSLEVAFAGSSKTTSTYIGINGIRKENVYLVFYDGKLMMENVDYMLQKNAISFLNGIVLDVNKKLLVLRV